MTDEIRKMNDPKNGADRLVLTELHSRLDWIDSGSDVGVSAIRTMVDEGFIENFKYTGLKVKVNGTWYER